MQGFSDSPDPEDIDTSVWSGQTGAAFLKFAVEALKKRHPGLSPVTKSGKDGAVDAWAEESGGRTILEAKFVSSTEFEDAKNRWSEVKKHLTDNLLPGKPKQ